MAADSDSNTPESAPASAQSGTQAGSQVEAEGGLQVGSVADSVVPQRRSWPWRVGTPVMFLLCGALMIVSAQSSDGEDLRPGTNTSLMSLVRAERAEVDRLNARAAQLDFEVQELSRGLGEKRIRKTQNQILDVQAAAGATEVVGPAVQVTLTDAPPEVIAEAELNKNWLVVHQQDIQAVANAMWRGGAEAVTIQGVRIISTTGIKCTGNAVQLQGVPYSPPYVLVAVGDQASITNALLTDEYLARYREQAANPMIDIGWDLSYLSDYLAPAYDGTVDLTYAKPMPVEPTADKKP